MIRDALNVVTFLEVSNCGMKPMKGKVGLTLDFNRVQSKFEFYCKICHHIQFHI